MSSLSVLEGQKPCAIFKSPLYPTPHKPFVSKSRWFYLQSVFRMRMFSLSPTENSLAQDFFILYLNNCKISLSYLTAHVLPFLPPSPSQISSQQHSPIDPFNTYVRPCNLSVKPSACILTHLEEKPKSLP